jgi:hypothetical protein
MQKAAIKPTTVSTAGQARSHINKNFASLSKKPFILASQPKRNLSHSA